MDSLKCQAIKRLRSERCSCVVVNGGKTSVYFGSGVSDLLHLLRSEPTMLNGAFVADKVVGKGAAALMIAGGVISVYAEVLSQPALELLQRYGLEVEYDLCVPTIINRRGDGPCPVEALCHDLSTVEECLPAIENFIRS